ncbi:hypothetical protein N8345_02750 [Flavobacteriaceae bacterium]|nr:hypothetical protein [Flavobacteriaceae bacterium]MDC1460770.1 hypothetical protein [Flavobacteriaceae bacterium]
MMIILQNKGFEHGGINFDAKTRRNSTDMEDLFIAHSGMDTFARVLITADKIVTDYDYLNIKEKRYDSFSSGSGKDFEKGKLGLLDLNQLAANNGEPELTSGKQELP